MQLKNSITFQDVENTSFFRYTDIVLIDYYIVFTAIVK